MLIYSYLIFICYIYTSHTQIVFHKLTKSFRHLKSVVEVPDQSSWVDSKKSQKISSDLTIQYIEIGNTTGPNLIFIHGLGDTSRSFSLMASKFKYFHCFIIDLPGFGNSSSLKYPVKTINSYGDDIISFMDKIDIVKTNIIGHSLGSFIAQSLAINYPARIISISLIGTAIVKPYKALYDIYKTLNQSSDYPDDTFVQSWTSTTLPINEEFKKYLKEETKNTSMKTWTSVLKGLLMADFSYYTSDISCSTFIIHGSNDEFFDNDSQDEIKKKITRAQYVNLKGPGHNTQWEMPIEVANVLLDFIPKENSKFSKINFWSIIWYIFTCLL